MQERKKISHLTHRNSVKKTIRMQLNPVGCKFSERIGKTVKSR